MTDVILSASLMPTANPTTPPAGWELIAGSNGGIAVSGGRFFDTNSAYSGWRSTSLPAKTGNIIKSRVTMAPSVNFSDYFVAVMLVDSSGAGYMYVIQPYNNKIYRIAAGQIASTKTQLATGSTSGPPSATTYYDFEYNVVTGALRGYRDGVLALTATDATYSSNTLTPGWAQFGFVNYTGVSQVTAYDVTVYEITSINGGNPITAGQTNIPVVAAGFPTKPDTVTATYESGTKSITATIGAGDKDNFAINIQDRIEGEDWPLNNSDITYTFSVGAASASLTQKLVKKAGETVYTFANAITNDPATISHHLAADGFTVDGGEHVYEQPPATGTMPSPNLALTPNGGGSVKEACTFTSWFRPATGTGAGNVYPYTWNISEAGAAPVDLNPDSDTFGTVSGRPVSTPTPAAKTITLAGMTPGVDVLAVPSGGLRYRVSKDGGATFGAFTTASTNVRNGYVLDAEVTSSSSASTTVTGTLTVGTVAFTLVVTTAAADNIPDTLVFSSTTNAEVLSQYTSETKTVTGMDSGQSSAFTVANGTYSKNGGAFISTAGTMQNGDTFVLRGTSDTYFGRTTTVTLTAENGNVVSTYRITNKYDPLISGNGGSDIKVSARKITGRKI